MSRKSDSFKGRPLGFEGHAEAQRQANGRSGEDQTRGLLGPDFVIYSPNLDLDGADLWVSDFDKASIFSNERLRVQSKFVKSGNWARFRLEHAMTPDGKARPDYFAFVHTLVAGDQVQYFFDAEEIMKFPRDKEGRPYFAPPGAPPRPPLKRRKVISRLRKALQALKRGGRSSFADMLLSFEMRNAMNSRPDDVRYLLKRIVIPEVENAPTALPLVIAVDRKGEHLRPIDARVDLHRTSSTFEWGYSGAGPHFTAWCILAHYFGDIPPTADQAAMLVEYLLSRLSRFEDHVITAHQIADALKRIDPGLREVLDAQHAPPSPQIASGEDTRSN